ncbi:MAG: hypothetical protein ING52_10425 [Burkholderiales bacterium]|jgi:hypothetical protein|nr:hypothetical protein [Burkholderiales bacterium]
MRLSNSIGHLTALAAAALAAGVLSVPAQARFVDQRAADTPAAPATTAPVEPRAVQPDAAAVASPARPAPARRPAPEEAIEDAARRAPVASPAPVAPPSAPPPRVALAQPAAAAASPNAPAVVAVTLRLPAGERLLVGLRDALAPHGVQVWIAPDDAAVHARSARELRASGPTLGAAIDALLRQAGLQGGFLDRDPQRLGISTVAIAAMAPAVLTGAPR